MRLNSRYNKKFLIICLVGVIVALCGLTIAYAALSSTLTISGSSDVTAATWNVYIENASFATSIPSTATQTSSSLPNAKVIQLASSTAGSGGQGGSDSCTSGTDCINSFSGTTGSFYTAALSQPGDFKAIQFDVVNGGTLDAELGSTPILSGLTTEQDVYLNYYVIYSTGSSVLVGDELAAGETVSMIVVIEYDKDITSSQLPTTDQSLSLSFSLNYIQAN